MLIDKKFHSALVASFSFVDNVLTRASNKDKYITNFTNKIEDANKKLGNALRNESRCGTLKNDSLNWFFEVENNFF